MEKTMKAKIIIFETESGPRYAVVWNGRVKHEFSSVTEAQIFCADNFIPFEPWE